MKMLEAVSNAIVRTIELRLTGLILISLNKNSFQK